MMTRAERAKQFMPFDAMKGLKEALQVREEKHVRVDRRELSEESKNALSRILSRLSHGNKIDIEYYCMFHDITRSGTVTGIDKLSEFILVDDEQIFFEDIYKISIKK